MRRIGSLSSDQQAQTLRDFLFTRDIEVQIEQNGDAWTVWVLDEDHVDAARQELAEFQADPLAQKYSAAATEASARRQAKLEADLDAKKLQINMRDRWERPLHQRIPVTILLIVASIGVTIATGFGENRELANHIFIQHVEYLDSDYIEFYRQLLDVRSGEVWRLVTPIFLHFHPLHIVFNMSWLFSLGSTIEGVKGHWRFLTFVLIIAVISNIAQLFMSDPTFGGMSGVVYGLFGYLWMKSKFAPDEGFGMPRHIVALFLVWAVLCLTGLIGPIANTAHFVGLFTGMILALIPVLYQSVRGR